MEFNTFESDSGESKNIVTAFFLLSCVGHCSETEQRTLLKLHIELDLRLFAVY